MSTVIKMSMGTIDHFFDKMISSINETERIRAERIKMSELIDQNVIRTNENYKPMRYTNGELLPKGMEAHIIALINGGLS